MDGIQNQEEGGIDCDGPCPLSCERKNLSPLSAAPVSLFRNGDGTVTALLTFRNFNTRYGLLSFTYEVRFYGRNHSLAKTVERDSFIYPGEVKYIVDPAMDVGGGEVVEAEVIVLGVGPFDWSPADDFPQPKSTVRGLKYEEDKDRGELVVSGLVVNEGSSRLRRVDVNVIVYNRLGFPAGVSKTVVQDLNPFAERFFRAVVGGVNLENINRDATKIYLEAEF